MKNIRIFYPKNCHFLVVKFSMYLNRRVLVMPYVLLLRIGDRFCAVSAMLYFV